MKFDSLTVEYLAGCLSPKTAKRYGTSLRTWVDWCRGNEVDPMLATRADIERFGKEFEESNENGATTAAHLLTAVCGVYRFGFDAGYLKENPAAHVRRPKRPSRSTGTWLTQSECVRLMDWCEAMPDPTYAALVESYLLLGVRCGEPLACDVPDMRKVGDFWTLTVKRKAHDGKAVIQQVAMADRLYEAYARMLGKRKDGPLFVFLATGNRLSSNLACRMVERACRMVGIERVITPHSLRRTFVTLARNAGIPDRDIMASGGWSSVAMLDRYDRERASVERHAGIALSAWLEDAGSANNMVFGGFGQ